MWLGPPQGPLSLPLCLDENFTRSLPSGHGLPASLLLAISTNRTRTTSGALSALVLETCTVPQMFVTKLPRGVGKKANRIRCWCAYILGCDQLRPLWLPRPILLTPREAHEHASFLPAGTGFLPCIIIRICSRRLIASLLLNRCASRGRMSSTRSRRAVGSRVILDRLRGSIRVNSNDGPRFAKIHQHAHS